MQLVAGEREQVGRQMLKVYGGFAHSLYGIGMKEYAFFMRHFGHALYGINVADLIVGKHDGYKCRVAGQGLFVFVYVESALVVHGKVGDAVSVSLPVLYNVKHGRMFNAGGDDVTSIGLGLQGRPDSGAVAFRAARGEQDFIGAGAKKAGQALPGIFHRLGHLSAEGVHA